jgi:hypothetical protein
MLVVSGPLRAQSQSGAATAVSAESVLERLASREARVMRYRETRRSPYLKQPLVHEGDLRYVPPDTLEKTTDAPPGPTYRIEGQTLVVTGRDGRASPPLPLSGQPALAGMVAGLRSTLRADLLTLRRHFRIELVSDATDSWVIALLPREPELGEVLTSISLRGGGTAWRSMEMREASGDSVLIEFLDTAAPAR